MQKRSFGPLVDPNTRLLVLGSLPGERSLAAGQYYAHPQNQFWRLIGAVIEADLASLDYAERLAALRLHGVGLWDVVAEARREGSLDTAIRAHQGNEIADLAARLPRLAAVAFNGGTAYALGARLLGDAPVPLVRLPSSSPAYTRAFDAKRAEWIALRAFLKPEKQLFCDSMRSDA